MLRDLKKYESKILSHSDSGFIRHYRTLSVLKSDKCGRVVHSLYFKNFWLRQCIIKELSNSLGGEKVLKTQFDLHLRLQDIVPIAKPCDYFQEDSNTYLVLEYLKGKRLQDYIDDCWDGKIKRKVYVKLLNVLLLIIDCVNNLHRVGYVHRDLSASNILVSRRNQVFLLDFGLTGKPGEKSMPLQQGFTIGYSSPQQRKGHPPAFTDDIYSLGGLILKTLVHVHPKEVSIEAQASSLEGNLVLRGVRLEIARLIQRCVAYDPGQRPSLAEIRNVLESLIGEKDL